MVELSQKHSDEEIARSLYRLAGSIHQALALPAVPPFDHLAIDKQLDWINLARRGPRLLEGFEGRSIREAALELYLLYKESEREIALGRWSAPGSQALHHLWEALTKHLVLIHDCDEAGSLEESEAVMLDWFQRKQETQHA